MGQLTSTVELLVGQMAGLTQLRNDPSPLLPPSNVEGDWYDEQEPPRGEVRVKSPRGEKAEKEKQEFVEIKGKIEKLERLVRKAQEVDIYMLELEGLFDGVKRNTSWRFQNSRN